MLAAKTLQDKIDLFAKNGYTQAVLTNVRMHLAHSNFRTFTPFSITDTICKFGWKVRRVALLDHGRFRPKVVVLPQCAHFAIFQFLSRPMIACLSFNAKVCMRWWNHNKPCDIAERFHLVVPDNKPSNNTTDSSSFQAIPRIERNPMTEETTPIGSIHISPRAVATIAFHAALTSYGVVGLTSKNLVGDLAQVLVKDPIRGVEVHYDGQNINVDLFVIIEYGTRIKSVAGSVANSVRFHLERALGMPVNQINVHVRGLRISNPD